MNLNHKIKRIWAWWKVKVRGYVWCEYECGCLAMGMSMSKKCSMCNTKIKELHKEKHEIQVEIDNLRKRLTDF